MSPAINIINNTIKTVLIITIRAEFVVDPVAKYKTTLECATLL